MTDFEWKDFNLVADRLSVIDEEAFFRSAISRYYYASFGSARYYLVNLGHQRFLNGRGVHAYLYNDLKKSPDYNEVHLGKILEILFDKRVDADYLLNKDGVDLDKEYFKGEVKLVKALSNQALSLTAILKNNPPGYRFRF